MSEIGRRYNHGGATEKGINWEDEGAKEGLSLVNGCFLSKAIVFCADVLFVPRLLCFSFRCF